MNTEQMIRKRLEQYKKELLQRGIWSNNSYQGSLPANSYMNEDADYTASLDIKYLPLEDYLIALQQIPIVFSAKVLFDDRPEEISIRIEYVENLRSLPAELLTNSNYQLTLFTNKYRIEGCKRINITYIQKEVIE